MCIGIKNSQKPHRHNHISVVAPGPGMAVTRGSLTSSVVAVVCSDDVYRRIIFSPVGKAGEGRRVGGIVGEGVN